MRRSRPVLALLAGVVACCGMLASCRTSKPPGELVVLVTTDLSVPKDIDTLHVNVSLAGGQSLLSHDYALGPTGLKLPATLGVVTGPHTTAPVRIQVSGLLQGSRRVSREAIVTLPTDRVAMLPMPLDWLCIGASCNSGETCRAGACVSATDPAIPKDYLPASGDAGGTADGGGPCFDTAACFESATLWPSFRADCTVSRPTGGAGVNVALVVRGAAGICGSGRCLVPLDAESTEGWQTSPDGARIELPLAVCANRDVTAVEVTTSCPTKQASAAICPGMSPPTTDGGCAVDADGGCPEGYVCEASSGKTECVLFDSGTTDRTRCHADSTLPCAGGAMGYSCNGLPDPLLQCDQVHHGSCAISGWCCVPAGDAGTCSLDAGAAGVLIDDMSPTGSCGTAQNKLPIGPGVGTAGYWFTADDDTGLGSTFPAPKLGYFTYTPVAATCSTPFSNAACMKSVIPYTSLLPNTGWAVMGFNFVTTGTNPDGGASTPVSYPVTAYKGIRFWARASNGGQQSISIAFSDVENDMNAPGAECLHSTPPLRCNNFYQYTQTWDTTWRPYEVDFDKLTQRLTRTQGFYTNSQFDQTAALSISFAAASDGVTPLTFDVCVADISFVLK